MTSVCGNETELCVCLCNRWLSESTKANICVCLSMSVSVCVYVWEWLCV